MIDCKAQRTPVGLLFGAPFLEKAIDAQVKPTVPRCWMHLRERFGLGALVLLLASASATASSAAVISGVVRDPQGVAQMGVLVQVLSAGSIDVASALTDMHGHYRIADLVPGSYQVRATSALLIAATRRNLRLSTGMLATVNLTVSMLSDPTSWLPAERRKADESGDDWTWTLRSAANRPILRMLPDGEVVSAETTENRKPPLAARVSFADSDAFAGGPRSAISVSHATANGSAAILRAETGDATQSTYVAAGYERTSDFAGSYRMVLSYASNPEIAISGGGAGISVMRLASAKKMQLGDTLDVEAGGTVYAIHTDSALATSGTMLGAQPFVRVTVAPGEVWAVRYTLSSAPEQSFDGISTVPAEFPVATVLHGRPTAEAGRHQEFAVSRKLGGGAIEAAIFHDAIDHTALAGVDSVGPEDFSSTQNEVLIDSQTGSFRMLGEGYSTNGASVAWSLPITPSLWATLQCAHGAALAARGSGAGQRVEVANSFTATVKGDVPRTGTKIRAAYRWQPQGLQTAVDPYDTPARQGYMSFYVRQAVTWGNRLPPGIEATVDVTNLLAQGYQPFLSADGRTLYLAESPRTLQAGLSFTF